MLASLTGYSRSTEIWRDIVEDDDRNSLISRLGFSSWEFPQLKTQSMISDSDGRNFPWYGGNKEIANIAGWFKF